MIVLDLRDLTPYSDAPRGQLAARSEAAAVMLWRFHRAPHTEGRWAHHEAAPRGTADEPVEVRIHWDEPTRALLASSRNEIKNVERAAEAVAIALADHLGFTVMGEAHHGSGCDWVMFPKGGPDNDYFKLEVSGIIREITESPEARLREKLEQGRGGDWVRPGIAVVVRFEDVRILSEAWR